MRIIDDKSEYNCDMDGIFSSATVQSIGKSLDSIDLDDRSRQYTFDEMIDKMISEGIYDGSYRPSGV